MNSPATVPRAWRVNAERSGGPRLRRACSAGSRANMQAQRARYAADELSAGLGIHVAALCRLRGQKRYASVRASRAPCRRTPESMRRRTHCRWPWRERLFVASSPRNDTRARSSGLFRTASRQRRAYGGSRVVPPTTHSRSASPSSELAREPTSSACSPCRHDLPIITANNPMLLGCGLARERAGGQVRRSRMRCAPAPNRRAASRRVRLGRARLRFSEAQRPRRSGPRSSPRPRAATSLGGSARAPRAAGGPGGRGRSSEKAFEIRLSTQYVPGCPTLQERASAFEIDALKHEPSPVERAEQAAVVQSPAG